MSILGTWGSGSEKESYKNWEKQAQTKFFASHHCSWLLSERRKKLRKLGYISNRRYKDLRRNGFISISNLISEQMHF